MTVTANKGYPQPVIAGNPNTWGVLLNQALGIVDTNMGGQTTINCAGNSNITVTSTQAANLTLILSGALTGNIYVYMPAVGGFNFIENNTTGNFTVTLQSAGGGTATGLTQTSTVFTFNDGTNQNVVVTSSGAFSLLTGQVLANISGATTTAYGVSASALLDYAFGSTQGNILYRGASGWNVLGPGTAGYVLATGGVSGNPSWVVNSGGGGSGVTEVDTGTGLTGGPITNTGTIGRDPVFDELVVCWYR